jgi:molybdopterin-guanine dinucleotide biosynthesis protein
LKKYITESLTYDNLREYYKNEYQLNFINHNHEKGEVDEVGIDSW